MSRKKALKPKERPVEVGRVDLASPELLREYERNGFEDARNRKPRQSVFTLAAGIRPAHFSQVRFAYEKGYAKGLSRGGAVCAP